jgi:Tfp pilus assembly protein PilX
MFTNQRGSGLLLVVMVFAVLFALVGLSLERSGDLFIQIQKEHLQTMALNLAEAGVDYALDKLVTSTGNYSGAETTTLETGTCSTLVYRLNSSGKFEIVATGIAKGSGQVKEVVKTVKVIVQFDREQSDHPLVIQSREEVL